MKSNLVWLNFVFFLHLSKQKKTTTDVPAVRHSAALCKVLLPFNKNEQ